METNSMEEKTKVIGKDIEGNTSIVYPDSMTEFDRPIKWEDIDYQSEDSTHGLDWDSASESFSDTDGYIMEPDELMIGYELVEDCGIILYGTDGAVHKVNSFNYNWHKEKELKLFVTWVNDDDESEAEWIDITETMGVTYE